jgi:hypothetical protein
MHPFITCIFHIDSPEPVLARRMPIVMNNTDVADNLVSMMNSPVIMMIDEFGFVVKRQL